MKDTDGLSRHNDLLIHCYLNQTYHIRANNNVQRQFDYFYHLF